jgi:hypothetical protein
MREALNAFGTWRRAGRVAGKTSVFVMKPRGGRCVNGRAAVPAFKLSRQVNWAQHPACASRVEVTRKKRHGAPARAGVSVCPAGAFR